MSVRVAMTTGLVVAAMIGTRSGGRLPAPRAAMTTPSERLSASSSPSPRHPA